MTAEKVPLDAPVGVVADVHADLGAVVDVLDRHPEVEQWICAGDVADMHAPVYPNAPVLRLLAQRSVRSVLGYRAEPCKNVQQTLGHASLQTTRRYTHARPDDSSARYLGV